MDKSTAATETVEQETVTPQEQQRQKQRQDRNPKKQPRYHVILWDDDDHSQLFHMSYEQAYQGAKQVDSSGQVICLTTTREHAELKRDQIRAFGRDHLIARCQGAMTCTIEPEC